MKILQYRSRSVSQFIIIAIVCCSMDLVLQSLSQQLQLAFSGDNRCRKDVYQRFLEQLRAGEKQSITCPDFAEHYTSGEHQVIYLHYKLWLFYIIVSICSVF